jgi:transposase
LKSWTPSPTAVITRSFQALGGVTRRGIYDNMKTAVDKVKKGKGRIVNAHCFAAMCSL